MRQGYVHRSGWGYVCEAQRTCDPHGDRQQARGRGHPHADNLIVAAAGRSSHQRIVQMPGQRRLGLYLRGLTKGAIC